MNLVLGGIAAAGVALVALPASATESGLTEMPVGVDTALPALVPAVGESVWLNYTEFYEANRLNGNDGNPNIHVPNFKVTVEAEAAKLVHTWGNIYGIDVSSSVVNVVTNTNITVVPNVVEGHSLNRGDTNIIPLIFHTVVGGDLHLTTATNVWVPDGYYRASDPSSQGLNRTTVAQQFQTTWLPTPKLDLSTSTTVEFGSTNPATHYHSGSYVNTDFHIGYRAFESLPKLELGVQGYYMRQFTNDTQFGAVVDGDGNKGMAAGVGPQVIYHAWEKGGIVVKYQNEIAAQNRPQGNRVWVQFALPF
jgi:hypothetical protein